MKSLLKNALIYGMKGRVPLSSEKRLEKIFDKIEKRKRRLYERGITEPSKFGYSVRKFISPAFRFVARLMYPKSGCVILGNTTKKDIMKLTKERPVIYAPAHRGVLDIPRCLASSLPHSYLITGGETSFYCTINEILLAINGVLYFDRTDRNDSKLVIERASKILKNNISIIHCPEGTYNLYSPKMLKLYPGIIKMALNTDAIIVPIGNEINILRDKENGKIIGDVNYFMYEDYCKEHSFFRPGDNENLVSLHNLLKDNDYLNIIHNFDIEQHINNNVFTFENVVINLDHKLREFLENHRGLDIFISEISKIITPEISNRVNAYLAKCTILYEYRKQLSTCLNMLEQRFAVLSEKINKEIDARHPKSQEEHERNSKEYVEYFLDVHEKLTKKGRTTAYDEVDRFINKATDESIAAGVTEKVKIVLRQIMNEKQIGVER